MGVMMNDFAACVLMELEKWMLNASPAMINMSTWLDSAEFAVPVSTLEEVQKRLTSDEVLARFTLLTCLSSHACQSDKMRCVGSRRPFKLRRRGVGLVGAAAEHQMACLRK